MAPSLGCRGVGQTLLFVLLPIGAYLLGSVSFAWIAGRLKGIDLREHGSGNLGATNAGRVLGRPWFAAVFVCDVVKGLVPVLLGRFLPGWLGLGIEPVEHQVLMIAGGAGAILGHVYTLFHRFRGGKAVATSLGVLLGLVPVLAGILLALWLAVWLGARAALRLGASEAVGPASVLASAAAPFVWWALSAARDRDPFARDTRILTAFVVLLAVLVVIRHRSNIAQMLRRQRS